MPKEYEHRFYDFDKKQIIAKIKSLNGTYKGTYLFKIQKFDHPLNAPNTSIRVRDEGYRITMTYKYTKDIYVDEEEVIIDNFDNGIALLTGLGCKKLFYFEKIREIWNIETKSTNNKPTARSESASTEIIFDTSPGITEVMEIESKTKAELNKILKQFELIPPPAQNKYKELFGIIIPKTIDLTFLNVKKELSQYVTKNNKEFIKLCN